MKFFYRPEIDGLRAISILGVVLFHFDFQFFSGGYLGVDVFIVISGFLITSFIFNRLKSNKFSFKEFLFRRAKRLLPSFFVVLSLSLFISYLFFLPDDLVKFCKSLISATFLSSNFYFWMNSGYWDETNTRPLLHTWSLSLEWQFYFIFSIFSILVWNIKKFKFQILNILLFFLFFSFFLALIFMDRSMSFFLLPFRLFEFLIGSFVYIVIDKKIIFIHKNKNLFSILGIFLIIISFIIFDSQSMIPGYVALMPCIGTAIIIYLSNSIVHDFLKNKIFVYLGLISYSLYLYHWPILIFYSWINIVELNFLTKTLLIILSIVLSMLNYHSIEKPMKNKMKIDNFFKVSLMLFLFFLILISHQIITNKGYPKRFSGQKNFLIDSISEKESLNRKKFLTQNIDLKFDINKKHRILILGDSNGDDFFLALKQNLNVNSFDIEYIKFDAWCFEKNLIIKYFSFFERINKRNLTCLNQKDFFKKNLSLLNNANYIILSSSWHKNIYLYIEDIIDFIKNHSDAEIIVSSKTVHFPDVSKLVYRINEKNFNRLNDIAYKNKYNSFKKINKNLKNKIDTLGLKYLDKYDLICSDKDEICNIFDYKNNQFYIFDDHHWTLDGAKFYGKNINYKNLFK